MAISLFGWAIRNLRDSEAVSRLGRPLFPVSFRLSAFLRNRGRYFAAGVVSVGFGPCQRGTAASLARRSDNFKRERPASGEAAPPRFYRFRRRSIMDRREVLSVLG